LEVQKPFFKKVSGRRRQTVQNESVQQIADYLDIVTRVDRTIYLRCRQAHDLESLARGLASLLPGRVHIFLHSEISLLPEEEDRMLEPLLQGETVLFLYVGDIANPLRFARQWDGFRFNPSPVSDRPGLLAVVQVFDNEEPVPYEGSTRWIFEEEVESIEAMGKDLYIEIVRLGNC
jgi:hypothetical protein